MCARASVRKRRTAKTFKSFYYKHKRNHHQYLSIDTIACVNRDTTNQTGERERERERERAHVFVRGRKCPFLAGARSSPRGSSGGLISLAAALP